MSKTKTTKPTKGADKATDKTLSKVKNGSVSKPAQPSKGKGKEMARKLTAKEEKSKRKEQKKKEPTPSSSESESSDSSDSSESESEEEQPAKPTKEVKSKPAKKDESSDSESESDSDEEMGDAKPAQSSDSSDSSDSESESEDEKTKKDVKAPKAKAAESSDSESDSDDSSDEAEAPKKEAPKKAAPESSDSDSSDSESDTESEAPKKAEASKEDSGSSDSDSDSSDSSDSGSDSEEAAPENKKRKADDEPAPIQKKSKTAPAEDGPTNLFVGSLSWNVDEEWLRSEFESFGELAGARVVTDRETGRSRGFGYVEFTNAADAAKAHDAKKDTEIDGRRINVDFASGRQSNNQAGGFQDRAQARARSFGDQSSPESDTLFVGNLPFSADEDTLRDLFAGKGAIMGIRLPTERETGRPKGFGYVQYAGVNEARQAMNDLNGAELEGRALRLDFSTPRPANGDAPRGGRGGGRGGFGGRGGRGGRGGFGGRGGGAPNKGRGGIPEYKGNKVTFD